MRRRGSSRSCKKKTFKTMNEAENVASRMMSGKRVRLSEQKPLGVYWCARHGGWHIGHTDWREVEERYVAHRMKQIRKRK